MSVLSNIRKKHKEIKNELPPAGGGAGARFEINPDGTLKIERNKEQVNIKPSQARALRDYLDQIL